jgi:hypothetical protein
VAKSAATPMPLSCESAAAAITAEHGGKTMTDDREPTEQKDEHVVLRYMWTEWR